MISKNIFIYHLDHELHKLFAIERAYAKNVIYGIFNRVTKLGYLLSSDSLLIPASNYFESDIAFKIINSLDFLNQCGYLKLISSSYNLDNLLDKKLAQHGENIHLSSYHYKDFITSERSISLPGTLVKRTHSASTDIMRAWEASINNSVLWQDVYKVSKSKNPSKFENEISKLPSRLRDRAYISEYILPLLPIKEETYAKNKADSVVNAFITKEYISSFLKEYKAVCIKDIPLIDSSILLPNDEDLEGLHISYKYFVEILEGKVYKGKRALDFLDSCVGYQLAEFKHSEFWRDIIAIFQETNVRNLGTSNNYKGLGGNDMMDIRIGIITALPKEYAAMKALISNAREVYLSIRGSGHRFLIGEIPSINDGVHKVVLGSCGMGNNSASIRATKMITHFPNLDFIIMTGIAGGIPNPQKVDEHVRLGDIVVSSEKGVTQYDLTKETSTEIEVRNNPKPPSAQLLESVSVLQAWEYEKIFPWKKFIEQVLTKLEITKPSVDRDLLYDKDTIISHPVDQRRNGNPRVKYGGIASANTLLKNPEKRDMLRDDFEVKAVEMEASGIADATWSENIGYLVVRGICDYCDDHKNDEWQEYASVVAAAYTRSLIESLPT